MTGIGRTSARSLLLAAALLTAALGGALAVGVPIGIPGEWVWRPNRLALHLEAAALAGLLLAALAWFICRPGRWPRLSSGKRAGALALLVAAAFFVQCGFMNAAGLPWISPGAIIASPVATTYYSASFDISDPAAWIATYPERMEALPYHARTHPPGFMLLFWLLRGACALLLARPSALLDDIARDYAVFGIRPTGADAAAAMAGALLLALCGAFSLAPLYLLAKQLAGAEAALCSTALMAGMPALLLFGVSPDQVVLTLCVLAQWLGYSSWRSGRPAQAIGAGVVLAIGLFFSFGLLILFLWTAAWAIVGLVRYRDRAAAWRRLALSAIAAGAGMALVYLALYLGLGYRCFVTLQEGLLAHRDVTTVETARSYWKWLLMNPAEAAVFAGLPLVVAAVWSWWKARGEAELAGWRSFLLAWLLAAALLDLSGAVRGEVGRIWLFLLWPLAIAAGPELARATRRELVIAPLLALQLWQALLMRGYLTLYDIL